MMVVVRRMKCAREIIGRTETHIMTTILSINSELFIYLLFIYLLMGTLSFAIWNATGTMSGASYASQLINSNHIQIFGIAEHWLNYSNLHFFRSIHKDYMSHGVVDNDRLQPGNRTVGKGGVAILWHRSLNYNVSPLDIDSDRICGIQYKVSAAMYIYFLQVYAPYSNHSIFVYREFIDYLQTIISMYSEHGTVIVMGDLNAHLQGQRFIKATDCCGEYLLQMMNHFNYVSVSTPPFATGATSSFVCYGGLYESLIDHVLLPAERIDTVAYCKMADDHVLNVSWHRPIICSIYIPLTDLKTHEIPSHTAWHKLDTTVLHMYESNLTNRLGSDPCNDITDLRSRIDTHVTILW